jgi:hypothetical protein
MVSRQRVRVDNCEQKGKTETPDASLGNHRLWYREQTPVVFRSKELVL